LRRWQVDLRGRRSGTVGGVEQRPNGVQDRRRQYAFAAHRDHEPRVIPDDFFCGGDVERGLGENEGTAGGRYDRSGGQRVGIVGPGGEGDQLAPAGCDQVARTSREVSYRSLPARRTVGAICPSACATDVDTTAVEPTTTIRWGVSRLSSASVTAFRTEVWVSKTGPPSWAPAAPAARASGKFRPVATYATGTPGGEGIFGDLGSSGVPIRTGLPNDISPGQGAQLGQHRVGDHGSRASDDDPPWGEADELVLHHLGDGVGLNEQDRPPTA
jgi:hypothetical protein